MNTKHTPGPWIYDSISRIGNPERGFPVFRIIDDGNNLVATTQESTVSGDDFKDCVERVEANARLIAAAPELLHALQLLVQTCESRSITPLHANDGNPAGALEIAKAAITKAEGK